MLKSNKQISKSILMNKTLIPLTRKETTMKIKIALAFLNTLLIKIKIHFFKTRQKIITFVKTRS